MVRHPARCSQGRAREAAPLNEQQARLLLSTEGRSAVGLARSLDLTDPLRAAEAMRSLGELGRLALDQAILKHKALAKHPDGDQWWWTAEALEQSTARPVAVHHAQRFAGTDTVLDIGCSVGGDLVALDAVTSVVGIDLDPVRLVLAEANVPGVKLVQADATRLEPSGLVFADPARRARGRRGFDPSTWSPPLSVVLRWPTRGLGVKVAPGIDYDALPADLEVEVVSLAGDVKEAVLWGGILRRGVRRTATLLPSGATLASADVDAPAVAPSGRYVMDPDGAVVRAHLVAELAQQVGGWLLDGTIAYITADSLEATAVGSPYGTWFEVLEKVPFSLKGVREVLRAHDAGSVVVKKRGTAVEPETFRRQLKLRGSRELTVMLTREQGRQICLVVNRLG